MVSRRALQTRLFAAFMVVLAACAAALFAHVAIDLAGDVLLAHDTYDGVDHYSRGEVLAGGLGAAATALLRMVWRALEEARIGRSAPRPRFEEIFGRTPWPFVPAVAALALPTLMTMELADVLGTGGRVDDLTDLLGGSALLGSGITTIAALLVAVAARRIARFIFSSHDVLVAAIGRLVVLLTRLNVPMGRRIARSARRRAQRQRSILARRCGKRGPPAFAI
jgi:hypothetical protein